jgi:ATP-dependent DNA helicase RecQ
MAARKPQDLDDFATISGVGEKKTERYGAVFLEVIHQHAQAA